MTKKKPKGKWVCSSQLPQKMKNTNVDGLSHLPVTETSPEGIHKWVLDEKIEFLGYRSFSPKGSRNLSRQVILNFSPYHQLQSVCEGVVIIPRSHSILLN